MFFSGLDKLPNTGAKRQYRHWEYRPANALQCSECLLHPGCQCSGNVEVELIGFNLRYRHHAAVFFNFQLLVEYIHYLVYVLLTQAVFVTVFFKALAAINHKNAFAVFGIFFIQYKNTGGNAGAVKQVGRQADNAFDVTLRMIF